MLTVRQKSRVAALNVIFDFCLLLCHKCLFRLRPDEESHLMTFMYKNLQHCSLYFVFFLVNLSGRKLGIKNETDKYKKKLGTKAKANVIKYIKQC